MAAAKRSETHATVLLLSSEPVVRAVIKDILEGAGYVVLAVSSFGAAVDRLAQFEVDLLITHPYTANIAGREAAVFLHAKNPGMGILMVAGLPDDDRLQIPANLEKFEVFPPPFAAGALIEKVKEALRKS